jgi:hypothetical protein
MFSPYSGTTIAEPVTADPETPSGLAVGALL